MRAGRLRRTESAFRSVADRRLRETVRVERRQFAAAEMVRSQQTAAAAVAREAARAADMKRAGSSLGWLIRPVPPPEAVPGDTGEVIRLFHQRLAEHRQPARLGAGRRRLLPASKARRPGQRTVGASQRRICLLADPPDLWVDGHPVGADTATVTLMAAVHDGFHNPAALDRTSLAAAVAGGWADSDGEGVWLVGDWVTDYGQVWEAASRRDNVRLRDLLSDSGREPADIRDGLLAGISRGGRGLFPTAVWWDRMMLAIGYWTISGQAG